MIQLTFPLAILIEILLPFLLVVWLVRRYKSSWKVFGIGMLTFVVSQLVHFPLLNGLSRLHEGALFSSMDPETLTLVNAAILGLLAGMCEEPARLAAFWLLKNKANTWGGALTLGAGHGGIESIIVGLSVLSSYAVMLAVTTGGKDIPGLPQAQVEAMQNMAWHMPLAGAVERIFTIILHLALSVMVWIAYSRRAWLIFALAILWHAVIDALAVILISQGWSIWSIEGIIAFFAILNLAILMRLYKRYSTADSAAANINR